MSSDSPKSLSPLSRAGLFFLVVGIVMAVVLFFVDPRATILNPGLALMMIGALFFAWTGLKKVLGHAD